MRSRDFVGRCRRELWLGFRRIHKESTISWQKRKRIISFAYAAFTQREQSIYPDLQMIDDAMRKVEVLSSHISCFWMYISGRYQQVNGKVDENLTYERLVSNEVPVFAYWTTILIFGFEVANNESAPTKVWAARAPSEFSA